MNIEHKIDQMLTIINNTPNNNEKMLECFTAIEPYQDTIITDKECSLIPKEDNLQLPNIFLRTKMMPEAEKFINSNKVLKENCKIWNRNLQIILECLEGSEIVDEEEIEENSDEIKCDEEAIEEFVKKFM
ncbi:hypothetical protein GVAV_000333 [Gurleya vavrai]